MKKLYHGTIADFDEIDLSKGRDYKDFGRGFYASAFPRHAESIARRNKNIAIRRQGFLKRRGLLEHEDIITAYRYNLLFDEDAASELNIKEFTSADREWLIFIMKTVMLRVLSMIMTL